MSLGTVVAALSALERISHADVTPTSEVARAGRQDYVNHCASCHGADATGNGPVAVALNVKPADLTRISARRGGKFPFGEMAKFIDGRTRIGAHGTREMPVWGEVFQEHLTTDPLKEEIVRGRVSMILIYLLSIQK